VRKYTVAVCGEFGITQYEEFEDSFKVPSQNEPCVDWVKPRKTSVKVWIAYIQTETGNQDFRSTCIQHVDHLGRITG
jgi:hypothetical protein